MQKCPTPASAEAFTISCSSENKFKSICHVQSSIQLINLFWVAAVFNQQLSVPMYILDLLDFYALLLKNGQDFHAVSMASLRKTEWLVTGHWALSRKVVQLHHQRERDRHIKFVCL